MHTLTSSPACHILASMKLPQRSGTCVGVLATLAAKFGLLAQAPPVEIRLKTNDHGSRLFFTSVYPAGTKPLTVTPLDANGDGHTDLAITGYENSLAILTNDGAGHFSLAQ